MSFATILALAIALLVGAPVVAHLYRRRKAEEQIFPPARLVPPTESESRKRSALEDRGLFAIRALAVVALALLGATPFVRCSRLALARNQGASVALAIVLDDSLSMRAKLRSGTTRFARALAAAEELTSSLGQGDAVAVVLAGAPSRVAMGLSPSGPAVTSALEKATVSDRGTDLDGALRLAKSLLSKAPQRDRRVVLLSDLADGSPVDAEPLTAGTEVSLWQPVPELEANGQDCAVTRADRSGTRVWARVVCTEPAATRTTASASVSTSGPSAGRSLEIRDGDRVLASTALGPKLRAEELTLEIPAKSAEQLEAVLTGSDAIAEDDAAPVAAAGASLPVAIVADATTHVLTGGPPPIEQAFAALDLDIAVRPLPTVPEHADELAPYAALVVDDAPGLTPETRRTIATWVERGGVALFTLGRRAASAPLGASFDPLVPGVIRFGPSPSPGIDPQSAPILGAAVAGLTNLAPKGRASVEPEALASAVELARWADGAPFLFRRNKGRGAVLVLSLPVSTDESDLALRPGFLSILEHFAGMARARGGSRRIDVGEAWTVDGYREVKVDRLPLIHGEKPTSVPVEETGSSRGSDGDRSRRAVADRAGLYALTLDGERTLRVASVPDREIDLRPRRVVPSARAVALGGIEPSVDASPAVALLLLGLVTAELVLRVVFGFRRPRSPASP